MVKLSVVLAALAVTTSAAAAALAPRTNSDCAGALFDMGVYNRPFVRPLFDKCNSTLPSTAAKQSPWTSKACVAAAIAANVDSLRGGLECPFATFALPADFPALDKGVYASIVGSGAAITEQNLVDLVYGAIASEENPVYPTNVDELKRYYLQPIFDWTATGASIPYGNFNDWLHYAPYRDFCYPFGCAGA